MTTVLDLSFLLLAATNVVLLVSCARAIARARLEIQGRLSPGSTPQGGHELAIGQRLPGSVLAELGEGGEPGLVAVLSERCPACLQVVERFERTRPPRLFVAFTGEAGSLIGRVASISRVLPAAASKHLIEWGGVRSTPLLFTFDDTGAIRWVTTRLVEEPAPAEQTLAAALITTTHQEVSRR